MATIQPNVFPFLFRMPVPCLRSSQKKSKVLPTVMLAKTCPERGRTTSIQNPYYISPLPSERQREGRFRLALAIAGLAGMTSELLNGFRNTTLVHGVVAFISNS